MAKKKLTYVELEKEGQDQRLLLEQARKLFQKLNYFHLDTGLISCVFCGAPISNAQEHLKDCPFRRWERKVTGELEIFDVELEKAVNYGEG